LSASHGTRQGFGLAGRALHRRLSSSRHVGSTSPTNAVATGKRLHPSGRPRDSIASIAVILFLDGCWHRETDWARAGSCKTRRPQVARRGRDRRQVLQRGHAACFLVKRVEKPTDNWPACLLCYPYGDADFGRSPAVGPGAFPDPPPRAWGPRRFSTEVPGPVLRAGPDVDTRPTPPKGHHEGD
jgi:hypothetical protein